jgi:hypothetical protein
MGEGDIERRAFLKRERNRDGWITRGSCERLRRFGMSSEGEQWASNGYTNERRTDVRYKVDGLPITRAGHRPPKRSYFWQHSCVGFEQNAAVGHHSQLPPNCVHSDGYVIADRHCQELRPLDLEVGQL